MASPKDGESDQGSFTPSECSDSDEHSERDSDYESEEESGFKHSLNIHWTGYGRKTPVILFNPESIFNRRINMRTVGERYHMAYKFGNSECKIVRNILNCHGFHEVHPNSSDYNIVWTGCHLKPFTLRSLSEFQKINHFPRSYELTRKDRLFKNIQKMQQMKGVKNFDIVPASYVLPNEYQEFCAAFLKDKGPWIVKPVASSRGRGIFLVNHPDQIPLDENLVVCRYVNSPLLIDGFKFDVRLYVAVTSYDPIQIYLYEEGLTRFATVKYEKNLRHMRNQCMHLTNYSINKKNEEYVKNDDADVEDYGNKWSLGAMLRYLRSNGKDTVALMMKIEDCIIKAIISVEMPIATACKMFMPFKGNCFELYGFDILIDENMKPWVLEVNLSPSLACDSPLDLKIKGYMLCDLFSMTGLICHDPMMRTVQQNKRNLDVGTKMVARAKKQRPSSAGSAKKNLDNQRDSQCSFSKSLAGLNSEEIRVVRKAREEDSRKGGWVRIFPTADTWDLYSGFLQFSTTYNLLLHQKLFPERHKGSSTTIVSKGSSTGGSMPKSAYIQLANSPSSTKPSQELAAAYASALTRTKRYERKLGMRGGKSKRKKRSDHIRKERRKLVQGVQEESGEENENENEDHEEQEEDEPPITERNISEKNNPQSKQMPAHPYRSNSEEVIQIVKEQDSKSDSNIDRKTNLSVFSTTSSEANTVGRTNEKNTEAEIEESPKEPLSPPESKYNVVDLLLEGHSMSKVQARTAFAMYLVRVQQRLITNSNSMTQDDVDGLNEQMDLVLRFLKRAAVNLQQPFKVIVPSRKLPLFDRRRILAKQLGDFVHIYNKETEHLHPHHLDKKQKQMLSPENMKGLDEEKFDRFVHTSSEGELEEVLTTYTRINKSASIFLGGKSPSEVLASQHVPTTGNSMQHVGATSASIKSEHLAQQNRHKGSATLDQPSTQPKILTGWEDVPKAIHSVPTSSSDLRNQHTSSHSSIHGSTSGNQCHQQRPATYSTISANSYATAVQIYTQKLSSSLRPKSAAVGGQRSDKQLKSRPASAHMPRPMSSASTTFDSVSDLQDPYDDKVISDALQRLTMRQQARQYSAFNGTSLVPSGTASRPTSAYGFHEKLDAHRAWPVYENNSTQSATSAPPSIIDERSQGEGQLYELNSGKCITLGDHTVKNIPSSITSYKHVHSAIDVKSQDRNKQTNINLQSANATFDSFIEDTSWQNELAMAYSQVTGVTPQNYHTPTQSSKQYQILQQQAALKQQSKVLLEQSKAKHQAQVAQAHAVQKSMLKLERPESEAAMTQIYAPKPPIRPGSRKAVSAYNRLPRRAVTEENSLNFQFNTSSKPDVNGAR